MGHQILENLVRCGFKGTVYPVNPAATPVFGVHAYSSIAQVPDAVDMAMIVVPKEHVLDVAEECGAKGVKGLIVISAGFRELGEEGAQRELRLMEIVRRHGMRMIGPNCMGVINADPSLSMNATVVPAMPPFGHSAFVSQSGALGMSVRVLTGMRGAPPCDLEAIATMLRRIGQLALDFPQIQELDVNPLMALEHGVVAVDARVRLSREAHPAENQRPMTNDRLPAVTH
jgi:acyl-CoA synthetase (NDP forming)